MVSYFTPNIGAVAGLVSLYPNKWLFSYLMTLDALMNNIIISGTLGWNHGASCKGGNFAYRRIVFNELNGFTGLDQTLSGDDDLFLQKIAFQSKWKVRCCPLDSALISSYAPKNILHFISQRKRHLSASKKFKLPVKLGYFIYFFSKISLFVSFILLIIYSMKKNGIFILIISVYLLTFSLLLLKSKKNDKKILLLLYPIWEIYYLLNHIFLAPISFFGKIRWGSR
jgi:cellulose synthase/poly-beta-1,6-N-acetylglucosamine synthase-like glycosyltransferase